MKYIFQHFETHGLSSSGYLRNPAEERPCLWKIYFPGVGWVARNMVSANHRLRGIKTYRLSWYLTRVSANHWLRSIKTYRLSWYLNRVSANHASSNRALAVKSASLFFALFCSTIWCWLDPLQLDPVLLFCRGDPYKHSYWFLLLSWIKHTDVVSWCHH